jgi:hypothetical protein
MRRSSLPPGLGPSFSVAEARDAGVRSSRLRAHDLDRPFHGVRTVRDCGASPVPLAAEDRLCALALQYAHRMTEHEFFSHITAAVLWQLPLPIALLEHRALELAVFKPRRAPASQGVRGHVVSPGMGFVTVHPRLGVRLTSPASTWAMLGGALTDLRDLVALADAVVREPLHRRDPPALASVAALQAAAAAGRRRGQQQLRASLEVVSTRSRSRPESWLRIIVTDAGLPAPRVNVDVFDGPEWLAQVDLAYPERRVAIEYEGEHHLTEPAQWAKDIARYERLAQAGWRVIRVTKADVFGDSRQLIARIRRALDPAGR